MDVLSDGRDFKINGKEGSRLGKVNLGLLRSQEDVHQSLVELEPRTYLFSAEQVIVRIPSFPAIATIQVVAALFTCTNLSLSMACLLDKAKLVLNHLAEKVIHLQMDIAIVSSTLPQESNRLNLRHFKGLKTLKISSRMECSAVEQLLKSLPDNLETLNIPYFSAEVADCLESLLRRMETGGQTSRLGTIHIPAQALTSMESRGITVNKPKNLELSPSARKTSYANTIFLVKQKARTLDDMCREIGIAVQPCSFRDAMAA
jgi:hypothetical protein